MNRQESILHLPTLHGSFAQGLAAGEIQLGLKSEILALSDNRFAQTTDAYDAIPVTILPSGRFINLTSRATTFLSVKNKFDMYHFNFFSSLFHAPWRDIILADLPYYSRTSKIIMTAQGSDVRFRYPHEVSESLDLECRLHGQHTPSKANGIITDAERVSIQKTVEKADKYVNNMFAVNPDLMDVLPGNCQWLPYPVTQPSGRIASADRKLSDRPLRVLHMSTNRVLKGTGLIERAVADAKSCGANIEFRCLVRRPYQEAQDALDWTDILIDQVSLGWYGQQAVQAMLLAKPVIVWLEERFSQSYFTPKDVGIFDTHYTKLAEFLISLDQNREQIAEAGKRARDFATTVHGPASVARTVHGIN